MAQFSLGLHVSLNKQGEPILPWECQSPLEAGLAAAQCLQKQHLGSNAPRPVQIDCNPSCLQVSSHSQALTANGWRNQAVFPGAHAEEVVGSGVAKNALATMRKANPCCNVGLRTAANANTRLLATNCTMQIRRPTLNSTRRRGHSRYVIRNKTRLFPCSI